MAVVLGAAPVAALWGPSPIPRAGGRCLDVIRLLRITTGSPAVEATSVRCQAVLEALRGRFDTARSMLADSRATVEELGLRHGVAETDLYTGIVELLAGEPAAAEPPLRAAYNDLGRLGIGADAGQAAAYLARALLRQGHLDEADDLAARSAELAGENPQTAITARTVQAEILAARGDLDAAVVAATDAVAHAEGTDIIVDHANASAVLARVSRMAGDAVGADRAELVARALYEQKAATVDLLFGGMPSSPTDRAQSPSSPAVAGAASGEADAGHGADRRQQLTGSAPSGDEYEPWSEADRLARRVIALFADASSESWLEMIDPNHVSDTRLSMRSFRLVGRDALAAMWTRENLGENDTSTVETIATRGECLALHRWTMVVLSGGVETDHLNITRWNDQGLVDLNVRFEAEYLAEAVAELERLYQEELGDTIEAIHIGEFSRGTAKISAGDIDGFLALHDSAFVLRDHRQLGWPDVQAEQHRERVESLSSMPGDVLVFRERTLRHDATSSTCDVLRQIVRSPGGAEQTSRSAVLMIFDPHTGLMTVMEQFEEDHVAEAVARFDELMAERGPVLFNEASQRAAFVNAWLRRGDDELAAAALADDATFIDEHGEPFVPFAVAWRRVIAIGGDRLALVELRGSELDGAADHAFAVEEIDDQRRIARVQRFTADKLGLTSAANLLDARWREIGDDSAAFWVGDEFNRAHRARDSAAMDAVLGPDFEIIDRRPLGFGRMDRDTTIATVEQWTDEQHGVVIVVERLIVTDVGGVTRVEQWRIDGTGEATVLIPSYAVVTLRDGLLDRFEFFPDDDPAPALARFEELVGTAPATPGHEPWNEADRLSRHKLQGSADRDAFMAAHAPGLFPAGATLVGDVETIAVRGEHLVLENFRVHIDGDATSPTVEVLIVDRWNDGGKNDYSASFSTVQLSEAAAELDRLYLDELGDTVEGLQRRLTMVATSHLDRGDIDGFLELHDPAFVMCDRRQLGWPELDFGGYRQRLESIVEVPGDMLFLMERVLATDSTLSSCVAQRLVFTSPDGRQQISRSVMVSTIDPHTGLITLAEQFEEDQVDEAVARFEELMAERGPVLHNEASQRASFVNQWLLQGDEQFAADAIADGATFIDEHGEPFELAAVAWRRTVGLAPATDRLALVELHDRSDDATFAAFAVEEIDDVGHLCGVRLFPHDHAGLFAATDFLEDRCEQIVPSSAALRRCLAFSRAYRYRDAAAFGAMSSPDFVSVDHRPFGLQQLSRADWMEAFEAAAITRQPIAQNVEPLLVLDERGFVVRGEQLQINPDGDVSVALPSYIVAVWADGLMQRLELFPDDDPAPALRRFEELTSIRSEDEFTVIDVVMTLDDSHRLCRVDRDQTVELLVIVTDDAGRIVETLEFGVDAEDEARRELNARWMASLSARRREVSQLGGSLGEVWVAPSTDSLDDLLTPDFELLDGRTLGMGRLDRGALEAALGGRQADGATGPPVVNRVKFVSDDVMVFRAHNLGVTPESGVGWEEIACNVLVADRLRITRLEMFDEDRWDEAMDRAAQLARPTLP